jgi:hypothetical protein
MLFDTGVRKAKWGYLSLFQNFIFWNSYPGLAWHKTNRVLEQALVFIFYCIHIMDTCQVFFEIGINIFYFYAFRITDKQALLPCPNCEKTGKTRRRCASGGGGFPVITFNTP